MRRDLRILALAFASALALSVTLPAVAQEAPAAEQAAPATGKKKAKPKKKPRTASVSNSTPANLEARHKECLAFIQRNGLSCDPWQQPTCGYELNLFRPLSCVAP